MMKPKQVVLWTIFNASIFLLHLASILAQCVAPAFCAIKTDSCRVSLMIINRSPVCPGLIFDPGTGAIMMIPSHNVVQAQWRHVPHRDLAGGQHDLF